MKKEPTQDENKVFFYLIMFIFVLFMQYKSLIFLAINSQ